MKRPDGTLMTPAEWTVERFWRWERLNKQQRSCHPVSQQFLPLFKRYAEGELGNMTELIEALERHHVQCPCSAEVDDAEGFEFEWPAPAASMVTGGNDDLRQPTTSAQDGLDPESAPISGS